MEFYKRAAASPARLAIFPGAFNPPTRAHMAMAEAALSVVDEVLFVLPRVFPHKEYTAAGFGERLELLILAIGEHPQYSLASSDRGLFIDLAREARTEYDAELFLLCGRDAAERIVSWDYGEGDGIEKQLRVFRLLVASRGGSYAPPPEIEEQVISIEVSLDEVSSSEVRRRIQAGENWEELVPSGIVGLVRSVFLV
jgi:nicotinate-nucleotide adenylyltransferase